MEVRFRHLARAAIVCGGHLLICRLKGAHSFLPGGGVEPGEGAKVALARELREELGLAACTVGRFLGVLETSFRDDVTGALHHEIDHVFEVQADGLRPDVAPPAMEPHLEFYWVPATREALARHGVLPDPVQAMLPAALASPCPLWFSTMDGGGDPVPDIRQILQAARSILVVDWPSRDVPDTLARAGYAVVVHGGPGPDQYSAFEPRAGEVVVRHTGRPPERADIVYTHRPLVELPAIVAHARDLGATAVWCQSGRSEAGGDDPKGCWVSAGESQQARNIVESAGMTYIESPYIADVVRELGVRK